MKEYQKPTRNFLQPDNPLKQMIAPFFIKLKHLYVGVGLCKRYWVKELSWNTRKRALVFAKDIGLWNLIARGFSQQLFYGTLCTDNRLWFEGRAVERWRKKKLFERGPTEHEDLLATEKWAKGFGNRRWVCCFYAIVEKKVCVVCGIVY